MPRPRFVAIPLLLLAGCVRSDFNLATQHQEYTITSTDKEVAMGRKLARRALVEVGATSVVLRSRNSSACTTTA